jgi:hypothetical protein
MPQKPKDQDNESPKAKKETVLLPILENETRRTGLIQQLSVITKQFDGGKKGFLTPAERSLREKDTNNQGKL